MCHNFLSLIFYCAHKCGVDIDRIMKNSPIFYDTTKGRWLWIKWSIIIFLLIISYFFIFTAYDISQNVSLPDTDPIAIPQKIYPVPADVVVSTVQNDGVVAPQNIQIPIRSGETSAQYHSRSIAFYVNWDDTSFYSLQRNIRSIDTLMPEWIHLASANGFIRFDDLAAQKKAVDFISVNNAGLKIVPLINNYNITTQSWDQSVVVQMLQDPDARSRNIQNILQYVKKYDFDGINIDYESIPDTSQADLISYMKELYAVFSAENLEVSQSVPLVDDSYNARTLAQYVDFLVFMAYDEHSVGSTAAGPIASCPWFVSGVTQRLVEASPQKSVIAYGNYGYDWIGDTLEGQSITTQEAMQIAGDAQTSVRMDHGSCNTNFSYLDDHDVLHNVWFLDAVSIFDQIAMVDQYQPLGYALWRMGGEDSSLWNVITHRDALSDAVVNTMKMIPREDTISYDGVGEILKVTHVPHDGKRDLTYDNVSGTVTDASFVVMSSSYRIEKFGGQDQKKIALTFDDGPDKKYTNQILEILQQKNVHATFFVIGLNMNRYPKIVQRINENGHEIGSHTFTHPNITHISSKQFFLELNGFQKMLQSTIGRKTILFRPPYAEDVEPETAEQISSLLLANDQGYYTVGMHIDPKDWAQPGIDTIMSRVMESVGNNEGNVVLLHDSGGNRDQTIAALPLLIDALQAKGYELVTVSDLIGVSHDVVMPPVSVQEQRTMHINEGTFLIVEKTMRFFYIVFTIGIFLGISRLFFIIILAMIHAYRRRQNKKNLIYNDFTPEVDVIVPAWNEANVIEGTIDALLQSDYEHFRVIVVDDGSTDGTVDVVTQKYGTNEKVALYTKANGGKSSALNYGIAQSFAPFVVALDADTLFTRDTITMLMRNFHDLRIGAVAGNTRVGNTINILTKLQALEYITSQNLERRAAEVLNAITVVPGAVGAWRRDVIVDVGGFSADTLAEDTDLTISTIRHGYRVLYEDEAIAFTESPDTIKNFNKQRFRWMFGTLQTAWKHKDTFFRPKYGSLGFFVLPNIFVFQLFFQIIAPVMDFVLIISVGWALWQKHIHQVDYSLMYAFHYIIFYYFLFLFVEGASAVIAFFLEKMKKNWSLLIWIIFQRFFYRQLMYYVAWKTVYTAIRGSFVGWGKFERKNNAKILG